MVLDMFLQGSFCCSHPSHRFYQYACRGIQIPSPFSLRHIVGCLGRVCFGDRGNDSMRESTTFRTGFFRHGASLSWDFRGMTVEIARAWMTAGRWAARPRGASVVGSLDSKRW